MNKTITNILYFSFAVVISKAIGVFNTFYLVRLLSPSDYGVWITLSLIVAYSPIACFGTLETMIKMYPFYSGKNESVKAQEIENGTYASILLSFILFLVIGIIISYFLTNTTLKFSLLNIRLMIVAASVSFFSYFYYYRLTARQNFKMVSIIDSIRAVTNFAFLITCSRIWGLRGTVVGYCINEAIIAIISYFICRPCGKVQFNFNAKLLWRLVEIGFPITIIWWVYMVQSSISRIVSIYFLGKTATGYLGLGVSIVSVIILIPMTVGRVIYPKINEEMGKTDKGNLEKLVLIPSYAISGIVAFGLGLLIFATPWIVHQFFPKYLPAIYSTILLLLGGFFLSISRNGINYLVAADKQKQMLVYVIISLLANIAICLLFVYLKYGVPGIALATDISTVLLTTMIWFSAFRKMDFALKKSFVHLIKLYLPFIIMLIFAFIFMLVRDEKHNLFVQCVIASIVFGIVYCLLILYSRPFRTYRVVIDGLIKKKTLQPQMI